MGLKELLHGCIKQYGKTDYKTVLVSQRLDPFVNKKQRESMERKLNRQKKKGWR